MNPRPSIFWLWSASFLGCTVLVLLSFAFFDMPVAHWASRNGNGFGQGLGSSIILTVEGMTFLGLLIARLIRGYISEPWRTTALACLTSMCTYGINDGILKTLFGVPTTFEVLRGAHHSFHFFAGSPTNSFPSGHMALAAAFAGVFMEVYPSTIRLFSALLALGFTILIFGDWHFVSDVVAGTFVGISTGLLAGRLWRLHDYPL